jgi:putative DNA primase/helicase
MLDVFRYVLGDYAMRVQSKLIEATKFRSSASSASPEIAQLKGARFLSTSEVEDGTKLATTLLKDLTGKENLSGRFLFKNLVEFRPEFKPWISANHLPDAPADDQAIWDRLRLVPFDNRIGPNDPNYNKHLDEDLKQVESTGILAWAVQGCLEWQRTGMTKPKCVIAATDDYRAQMDYFKDFLAYVNESQWIELTPTPLRQSFMEWCKTTGTRAELTQRQFKKAMEEHGWTQSPSSTREWQPPEEQ